MKSVKIVYAFLTLLTLTMNSLFAQLSGTTTQPTSTTSTNRQQELYDQYHGYNKKSSSTAPATLPATTADQPQQRTSDYSTSQPTGSTGQAQSMNSKANTSGTRIGVRGGVTYELFTEEHPLFDPIIGFVGGLTFNLGAGTFSFQPEVNYARYSVKITEPFSGARITSAGDHVEIPLFLKISTGSYAGHRFFVNIGPYGSYLISASSGGKKLPVDGLSNRFSYGAAAGVGAAIKAGSGHAIIEVRGLYELSNTNNGFNSNYKQVLTQATIGYSFPLGSR
ncbi:porin family protein [Spirosoma validum]|uniref:PorT family protein n=1 Tax=Spirosoma validum TaxID=2771355 RepID=A0A927GGH2_9BACT|nr:porin family protein [Spirosoma validum]MBD2756879.1 PorT family protein [Spirosoma validum]